MLRSPERYMVGCMLLDIIVGLLNLYFKWFSMEFVTIGFITLLALPLLYKPFGLYIGLRSGIFWR